MSLFSVTNQGVITVDTVDIKSEFEQAYKEALGADLNLDVSTPVGQLVVNDTTALTTAMAECVAMANEGNVYYATGQALDVAAAFYGYYRKKATATTVVATLTGTQGTTIAEGSLASDGTNESKLLNTITIPSSGSVTAEFQCTTPGVIECPAGSLTTIVTEIDGWSGVTNANDGIVGMATENDNAFRDRITANWMNKRARSILGAIIDNVAALNDVVSVAGHENPTGSTITYDGESMEPHSILISVLGGNGTDIARVIGEQKTLGAVTLGNTEVAYTDDVVDYHYTYKIYRPDTVTLYVKVEWAANAYTGASTESDIKGLIMNYINGNPFRVAQTVSGNMLCTALAEYNKAEILSIKVSDDGTTWADYLTTKITEVCVLSQANITVTEVQ